MARTKTVQLGRSIRKEPIPAWTRFGPWNDTTMVLAGMHGDEPKGVDLARRLIAVLERDAKAADGVNWVIVPVLNPDGYARRKRRNARNVDLNRNFPTRNWVLSSPHRRMFGGFEPASEPETRAVMAAVERYEPRRIITIHSIGNGRECNNYDGPGRRLAEKMARINGYPVRGSIGYPTPGSFGTWAGRKRRIAVVTLELPSRDSSKRCWERNRDALLCR